MHRRKEPHARLDGIDEAGFGSPALTDPTSTAEAGHAAQLELSARSNGRYSH